jgi:hypothetical protein
MEREKYIDFTTEEFILDEEFVCWVLSPDDENDFFWKSFLNDYPGKRSQLSDAILIIRSLSPVNSEIPSQTLEIVFQKIMASVKPAPTRYIHWMKYAAGIAFIVTAGVLTWTSLRTSSQFPIEADNSVRQKGKVIFSSGVTREFETDTTIITQTSSGNLMINNDTIKVNPNNKEKGATALTQIIIPYGKRSEITLADGTHIWLNSGSQLSYPSNFKANSRDVYLSGEAFFDVAHDATKPFYVITRDFKIKVLGTRFNVSSYSEDQTIQAVLLEGKISAGKNNNLFSGTIDLQPGERVVYDKADDRLAIDKVDVQLYASWINGYLIFENEPINEVFKKLERYYNQKIVLRKVSGAITFSGKLDLKENIEDMLENISYASSVTVTEENGTFIIN